MATTRRVSHVYQVIAKPKLIAGVDFSFMVVNAALCALALLVAHFPYWILMTILIHKVLQVVAKNDPLLRQIYMTYSHQGTRYSAWAYPDGLRGQRPRDLGRGALR